VLWISLCYAQGPFDLHVLGTPPAFVLSQDQTLKMNIDLQAYFVVFKEHPPQYLKVLSHSEAFTRWVPC